MAPHVQMQMRLKKMKITAKRQEKDYYEMNHDQCIDKFLQLFVIIPID